MTISEESVTKICEILERTRDMELDDLLMLADALLYQTKDKSKLRGPPGIIFLNLSNRTKRRIKEGYVPPEAIERISRAALG